MKWIWACSFSLIFSLATLPAFAAGRLDVSARHAPDTGGGRIDSSTGEIEIILSNKGDSPLLLDEWTEPHLSEDGMLLQDILEITLPSGKRTKYLGALVSYSNEPGLYTVIKPGEQRTYRVNIRLNYEIEPGVIYNVTVRPIRYLPRAREEYAELSASSVDELMLASEPTPSLVLWVNPGATLTPDAVQAGSAISNHDCAEEQLLSFYSDMAQVSGLTFESVIHWFELTDPAVPSYEPSPRFSKMVWPWH